MNTEWNHKLRDMKNFKDSRYENKRLQTLQRLDKKETSTLLTKININSTITKFSENFNNRLENAKSRIYQQTEVIILIKIG